MKKQSQPQLLRKVKKAYREYWSIIVLTSGFSIPTRKKLEKTMEHLDKLPHSKLSLLLPHIQSELSNLRQLYGVKVSLDTLEAFAKREHIFSSPKLVQWQDAIPTGSPRFLFITKSVLSRMFENYHLALEVFPALPPHALISIDVLGEDTSGNFEVYMLEASLFEDMAILWNTTWEYYQESSNSKLFDKIKHKRLLALNRATAKAAFNFLEGFLNGLAYDILLTQEPNDKEKEILIEWDEKANRQKAQSLRQKLLRYPRIALELDHAPIDENRSDEISRVLGLEQQIRHSLIHPTPRPSRTETETDREYEFRSLSIETVGKLCDDVIQIVFNINNLLQAKFGNVEKWLFRRGDEGRFNEEVFF